MARYEEGGADFAQEQFAKARDYREEQAKQQEKFAKNLQLANLALTGANWFINEKADALENSRVVENSWWQTQLESAQATQKRISDYEAQGLSRQQMYEADIRGQLDEYLQGDDEDGKIVYTNIQDGIEQVVEEFKKNQVSFDAWNKSIDAQLNIPNITKEDAIAAARVEGGKAPRSLGALFGNKIYKTYKSHTAETLAQEDKNAKERIVGSLVGEQFKAAREAVRAYGETGSPISSLAKYIKDNPETVQKYNQETVKLDYIDVPNEETNTIETFAITSGLVDGVYRPVGRERVNSQRQEQTITDFTNAQLGVATSTILKHVENTVNADYLTKNYDANTLPGLANRVLTLQQRVLKSGRDYTPDKALQIATDHILNMESRGDSTGGVITLHEIDAVLGDFETERMQQYIDSIKKEIKDPTLQQLKLNELIIGAGAGLAEEKNPDTKLRETISLERVLKVNDLPTIKQLMEMEKDLYATGSPEKTFYDDVKDYAYIGSVAEFMFGEELDVTDALWLIPGAGLVGGGLRIAGKAMMPRVAQALTSSRLGQRFFNKIKMKNFNPNNLTKTEKAMYNSLNKSGKSLDIDTLSTELLKIPGVAFKGTVGNNKILYGGSALAIGKGLYEFDSSEDEDKD
jgi:hypothetical protein